MRCGLGGAMCLSLLAGSLVAACEGDPAPATAVVVFVQAEPIVRADTDSVRVEVYGSQGRDEANNPALRREVWLGDRGDTTPDGTVIDLELQWPVRVVVAPLDGNVTRVFRVRATALDASSTPIGKAQVLSGYQEGEILQILLTLEDACQGVLCAAGETCTSGVCVEDWQEPALLPPYRPDGGTPDGGADDGGTDDGGTDDGGPLDAGTDACAASVGEPCDGDDPDNCASGVWECTSGTLSCTDDADDDRKTFYLDIDGDGYGVAGVDDTSGCNDPPSGYAEVAGDCCDDDNRAHPGQLSWFRGNNNCGQGDFNCSSGRERRLYDLTNATVRTGLPLDQCADNCMHVPGWESVACSPCLGGCGFSCRYHYGFDDFCGPSWGDMVVECR